MQEAYVNAHSMAEVKELLAIGPIPYLIPLDAINEMLDYKRFPALIDPRPGPQQSRPMTSVEFDTEWLSRQLYSARQGNPASVTFQLEYLANCWGPMNSDIRQIASSTGMANNIGTRSWIDLVFQACLRSLFLFVIILFVVNTFITSVVIVIFVHRPLSFIFVSSPLGIMFFSFVSDSNRSWPPAEPTRPGEITAIADIDSFSASYLSIPCLEFDSASRSKLRPYYTVST
ncbi:hypothetical protein BS47DRAFT_1402831 [Hydnum rufescens UP504]|uniref:Uncharacterized protein n=1 Tax=Hydnum rufescens UP504 TaxID=1448309 RepID=A0A9P6ADM7_9AGAM|nr:hypothetical protein BS47DRAFT_1402831 [Hydnum rufescens UP504]